MASNNYVLEFSDKNGQKSLMDERELIFLCERFSLKKIYCALFVLKRLIEHRAYYAFYLFFSGFVEARIYGNSLFDAEKNHKLKLGIIGLDPVSVTHIRTQLKLKISGREDLSNIFELLYQIVYKNQYNLSKKNTLNKVVVDAGANIGIFSILSAIYGAKRVYAFEPVKGTFAHLKNNIAMNGLESIIFPINKALGKDEKTGKIAYDYAGDGSASLQPLSKNMKRQAVEITTIDLFLKNKPCVNFIKIDVEGYEANVLQGAANTIKNQKPILSFSAYHKPADKTELPALVKSFRKDYICTLYHHAEDDFYCE